MFQDRRAPRPPPFFTAPPVVLWLAGLTVALHLVRLLIPMRLEDAAFYHFALIPGRLDLMLADGGNIAAYGPASLLAAGLGHMFLHVDWVHVLLNMGMLLALGAPVARRLGAPRFLILFVVAGLAGAVLFFTLSPPNGAPAIGASGAVCGVLAAALMLMADPRATWPVLVSPQFLKTSAAFLLINVILALAGPSLFGAAIAWDAHIGGYVAGALMMAAFASR